MRAPDRQKAVAAGLALGASLILAALPGRAEPVAVRSGEHPGMGRLVFDWSLPTGYRLEQLGGRAMLHFDSPGEFRMPAKLPRNVLALRGTADGVEVTLRSGAQLRPFRLGERIVLDVLDPPAPRKPEAKAPARPVREAATREARNHGPSLPGRRNGPEGTGPLAQVPALPPLAPGPAAAPMPDQPVSPPPAPTASVAEAPKAEPPAPAPSAGLPVRVLAPPGEARVLALPLPAEAGLAVLRRGNLLLVVSDLAQPLDLSALRDDPVFGSADLLPFPEATVLRLRLAPPAALRARREGERWLLEPVSALPQARSIRAGQEDGMLVLRAAAPGRVVALPDPETGLPLLVGTVREPDQMMPQARRLPQAELLPTTLGAALLARGDAVDFRSGAGRFLLSGAGESAAGAEAPAADARGMTRLFDLPALDAAALSERLRAQQAGIAAATPLQRAPLRRAAAETLLSLGQAQEAQAMLRLAFQEDPQAGLDPVLRALQGAAALLGGRLGEAGALEDPTLARTDETALWQGLLRGARGEGREAAPGIAASVPVLLSYPPPLRSRLLAPAVEALLAGGERAAARRLLDAGEAAPALAELRGRLAEAEGRRDEALAAYEAAMRGRDRPARARAIRQAVELRLSGGQIDAGAAADTLEEALYSWRGESEELAARQRIAALRQQAGNGRAALAMLQETARLFPDRGSALRPLMRQALATALEKEAPVAAIALADAHPDLLAADPDQGRLLLGLADRLVALDLPARAAELLQRGMVGASGEARARLGLRLAGLRLEGGDIAGAAAALPDGKAQTLPPDLERERKLLSARLLARQGREDDAVALLRGLGSDGAEPLAEILAGRHDWSGASEALAALAAAGEGEMDDTRRQLLLRAAAYAVLSGDAQRLGGLRARWAAKLGDGKLAQDFNALTLDPVQGMADLPRLQRELNLFRGFSGRLDDLRADAGAAR
ncbi:hypothetical protein MVG78_17310 [Roseomonas gilardii subsp. gilardii]|uniref:hypothetical protein n=1 Tax=Roseomonas gilardii TaxID=257708 RepID=UPI001FFA33A6|nr:hypothetical protein [Roseomonas gilardii]UPG72249.1 hypothetical protein MVG78_17310 [Roseomonas gilardii subsp. gilardii]